jgi:exopolysaccharide biosynthesis polyprenyl glycosylphosphotransferase
MLKQRARLFETALVLVESGVWAAAFLAARAAAPSWDGQVPAPLSESWPILAASVGSWLACAVPLGLLGRSRRMRPVGEEVRAVALGVGFVAVAGMAALFLLHGDVSRVFLGLYALLAFVGLSADRLAIRSALRTARVRGYNYRNVVIVGDGLVPDRLLTTVRNHPEWGLHFAGFVRIADPPGPGDLGGIEQLPTLLRERVVDAVLFAVGDHGLARIERALAACDEIGVDSHVVLDFFPHKISRLALDELGGFPVLGFHATPDAAFALLAKRVFDVVTASVALVLGAPVLLAIALAIRAGSPGPVLFVQNRVGLNGRPFALYKFRTMVPDAEARQAELLAKNEMQGPAFKLRDDPRVTPFGRWLRKTSLDELPQLWNVLRGEMSVVGPRPPIPTEVARYERAWRRRLSVKPGLTCLWQVSGRNENPSFEDWMRQDLSYIDNWSLWLDLKIVFWTVPAVLFMRGAR